MPRMLTYWDLLYKRDAGDSYYQGFGFEFLEISEDYAHITERRAHLAELFDERYAGRELAYETLPMWQLQLQRRMDEIASRYERMYSIYVLKADELASPISDRRRIETYAGRSDSNSDTQTRNNNTPDSSINLNTSYADSVSNNESSADRTDDYTKQTDDESLGVQALQDTNAYMDSFRDLDISLISEFENLFLNVF